MKRAPGSVEPLDGAITDLGALMSLRREGEDCGYMGRWFVEGEEFRTDEEVAMIRPRESEPLPDGLAEWPGDTGDLGWSDHDNNRLSLDRDPWIITSRDHFHARMRQILGGRRGQVLIQ